MAFQADWIKSFRAGFEDFAGSPNDLLLSGLFLLASAFLLAGGKREGWGKTVVWLVGAFLGLRYFLWRGFFSLNDESPFSLGLSVGLLSAELLAYTAGIFFFFLASASRPGSLFQKVLENPSGTENPEVDVLIYVRGQSPEDLHRSLVGGASLDYPLKNIRIAVFSQKDRSEIKDLAEGMGHAYFCLQEADGKAVPEKILKKETQGELVLFLEAGDVPVSSLLKETVGKLKDPKTAFVQCGFNFSALDNFQRALFLPREISHEHEVLNRVVQSGLSRWGGALSFGSGTVFRREAFDLLSWRHLSGSQPGLAASFSLHRRGFRSVFLDKPLIIRTFEEEVETAIFKRGMRVWESLCLFLKGVPFFCGGMTLGRRLAYLFFLPSELLFLTRFLFLLTPLAFFIGPAPIRAETGELFIYFLPFFIWNIVSQYQASGGHRHPLWTRVYETADVGSGINRVIGGLGGISSPPTRGKKLRGFVSPFVFLGEVQVLGILAGFALYFVGALDFPSLCLGVLLAVFNIHLICAAAGSARRLSRKRGAPRLDRSVPCRVKTPEGNLDGQVVDINEDGVSVTLDRPVLLPVLVGLEIGGREGLFLSAQVRRNETFPWGGASVGLRFDSLSKDEKKELIKWLYCNPADWQPPPLPSWDQAGPLFGLFTAPGRVLVDSRQLHRTSPRYEISVPCRIILSDRVLMGNTLDFGTSGISLRVREDPGPLAQDLRVELQVQGRSEVVMARVVWTRHRKNYWDIGITYKGARGMEILENLLPLARVKFVPKQSLHVRAFRSMFHAGAFALSIGLAFLAFVYFLHETNFQELTQGTGFQTAYGFFWMLFFLIAVDGVKVYVEVAHRATPRRYHSDLSQVTAVIPCRNTGKAVEYTIEGLRRILKDDQIIIVDDASTDNTAEIARRMGVRVISLKENVGKPRALGIGFDAVRTRYTLILDDDSRIQSLFLPTSLLEEGNTGVAFYVLPCRRTRENYDGKQFVSCLQRYEYAKSMEIGKRFQDKSLSVSCISGAIGLFRTDRLRSLQPLHSAIFPGEDLERTLIDLTQGGRITFVNEPVWTICPDNWKDLARQRLFGWNPGFFRLAGYYWKILKDRSMPVRLRWEMLYNFYVMFSDPFKILSFCALLLHQYWLGLGFLYFFYLALEVYPFLTVEKKLPTVRYYLPALFFYPLYGIFNTFMRFGSLFHWLWHRYITKKWKPRSFSVAAG